MFHLNFVETTEIYTISQSSCDYSENLIISVDSILFPKYGIGSSEFPSAFNKIF